MLNTILYSSPYKQLLALLIAVSVCSGCIPLPVPDIGSSEKQYMESGDRSFLKADETTREEVLVKLGSPTGLSAEPSHWVYAVEDYLNTSWDLCALVLLPHYYEWGLHHSSDPCPVSGVQENKHRFLELVFNDVGIVSYISLTSLGLGDCSPTGLCWDGEIVFLKKDGEKVGTAWNCAVHLFNEGDDIAANLEVSAQKKYELSLTQDSFHILLLQQWEPEIRLRFDDGSMHRLPVHCDRTSALFVMVIESGPTYGARQLAEPEGRQLIINKERLIALNVF